RSKLVVASHGGWRLFATCLGAAPQRPAVEAEHCSGAWRGGVGKARALRRSPCVSHDPKKRVAPKDKSERPPEPEPDFAEEAGPKESEFGKETDALAMTDGKFERIP